MAFVKDPGDAEYFGRDWTDRLEADETITTSTWASSPTGLTVGEDEIVGLITKVWLSGGTAEADYTATNHIVTSTGRELEKSFEVMVRNL